MFNKKGLKCSQIVDAATVYIKLKHAQYDKITRGHVWQQTCIRLITEHVL